MRIIKIITILFVVILTTVACGIFDTYETILSPTQSSICSTNVAFLESLVGPDGNEYYLYRSTDEPCDPLTYDRTCYIIIGGEGISPAISCTNIK